MLCLCEAWATFKRKGYHSCSQYSTMALESVCGLPDIRGPCPELCGAEAWSPSTPQCFSAHFAPPGCRMEPTHGTTTLAFVFQHGVIAAADSRASCGNLVSSPDAQKVLPIHSSLLATTSGSSADCSIWARVLARECRLYEVRHGCQLTVASAAKLLSTMLYRYRGLDLCVATILCGWDHRGPSLFYVYSDGRRLSGNVFSVGSGSPYAYSVLDTGYRYEMSTPEAYELARRAVYHATHRDAYSGGNVDLYHIQEGGWAKVIRQDTTPLYYGPYRPADGSHVCGEEDDSLRSQRVGEEAICGGSEEKQGLLRVGEETSYGKPKPTGHP